MIFVEQVVKPQNMKATTTVLLVLILLITFPFWIALAAVVFGLVVGIFGGIIGLIGGIFGGIFGFDSWHMGWNWPHFHFNKYVFFALLIIAAIAINKRQSR